jgi:hypothetical protein
MNQEPEKSTHRIEISESTIAQVADVVVTAALWAGLRFLCVLAIPTTIAYIGFKLVNRLLFS